NLASTLSLTLQNLPTHFDHPEFREDALRVMNQSVTKVNNMCRQLSMLSKKVELSKVETDLNKLVMGSLSCLNGDSSVSLIPEFLPIPRIWVDPDQIEKVVNNLLLNAKEALVNGGIIRVTTVQKEGWVIISINDSGCGMSKEFIQRSLFQPFKSTKKEGLGIGLYQSKMIVEAHKGHIEVESEEGKGTTFRVLLPINKV
ncbi:MAG: GHKL domain-containing protein, partial [Deltaproteobacteria bacterium]|nr:GHKL domain-containing protein [Deltaproteobacteria bacterium]